MSLSLYQIEKEYMILAQQIIDLDGDVTPELAAQLEISEAQLEHKGRGYGFVIKQAESEIDQIDLEIKRLQGLKASRSKMVDRMKETLKTAMEMFGVTKIESPTLKLSFSKSESVEVDESILPSEYFVEKVTKSPDKAKIKYYLKQGDSILGAKLVENQNLQIK